MSLHVITQHTFGGPLVAHVMRSPDRSPAASQRRAWDLRSENPQSLAVAPPAAGAPRLGNPQEKTIMK